MEGSSIELQEISLVALYNDPYLLSKTINEIREGFFVDNAYKLIYKSLKAYYVKYATVPSLEEFKLMVREKHSEEYGDISEILKQLDKICNAKISSEDFVYEKVTEFIRRNKIEESLNKVVEYMREGNINLDTVATDLRDSIYLNFAKAPLHNLADISSIREIREEALGDTQNPVIIKFFIDGVNQLMQYKGLIPGTLNMISAPPGTGKTTLLINQGVSIAQQGFKVLHIFLADMSRYDGLLRYLSCYTGVPTSVLVNLTDEQLAKFIQKNNMTGMLSNIDIASYGAEQLDVTQLIEEITTFQKENHTHYNAIIVDYDENVAQDDPDNMYKSGGNLYNRLALFSVLNKTVTFIASQPKTTFWGSEILPLESASESSKKQKIIDLMITMGKPSRQSEVGTLFVAKNRRGEDGKVFRLGIDGANCQMKHITELEYQEQKKSEGNGNVQNIRSE